MDDERFCPSCGENVTEIPVAPNPAPAQPSAFDATVAGTATTTAAANTYSYSYTATQPQYQQTNPYYAPQQVVQEEKMGLGKWVLTICLTNLLGIVSIVLLFVWAFGNGPEERQLYCKAALIFQAIVIVLYILFMILYVSVFASILAPLLGAEFSDSLVSAVSMMF